MRNLKVALSAACAVVVGWVFTASAEIRVWTGEAGDGLWESDRNWSPTGVPQAGDTATVGTGAAVTLSSATPKLGLVTFSGAKVLFREPNRALPADLVTALNAATVSLENGAVVTHATNTMTVGEFKATEDKQWRIDGRVAIFCDNLTIDSASKIDVSACGYCEAKDATYGGAAGPGGTPATNYKCGGSYGGIGSNAHREQGYSYGVVCGDVADPLWPGSAGCHGRSASDEGFSGGGLVRIVAAGKMTINGGIRADSGYGWRNSQWNARWGGSGGGVYLSAKYYEGSGLVTANGLCGETVDYGGGGGRVAVHYDPAAQASAGLPSIRFSADAPSCNKTTRTAATPGTVWFTDARFVPSAVDGVTAPVLAGIVHVGSTDGLSISSLSVSNARFGLSDKVVSALTLSGGISVSGKLGELTLGGDIYYPAHEMTFRSSSLNPVISAASVSVLDGAAAHLFAAATNAENQVGGELAFGDRLTIGASGVFNVWCHPTNGAIVKLSGTDAEIQSGGTLQSDQAGFIGRDEKGWGPGAGSGSNGAGHGGMGPRDNSVTVGRLQYDDLEYPCMPGSSGGTGRTGQEGSAGGGVIHLTLTGDLINDGTISADAKAASLSDGSGSGSGGTVFVSCHTVTGTGAFTATGSGAEGKVENQGAGGRIAVHYDVSAQQQVGPMGFNAKAGAALNSTSSGYNTSDIGGVAADMGTVWLSDAKLLGDGTLVGKGAVVGGELHLGDWSGWNPSHLVVDGGRVRYAIGSHHVDIAGDMIISNRAQFGFGGGAYAMSNAMVRLPYTAGIGPVVRVRGNLTIVNNGNTLSENYPKTTFHLLAGDNVGAPFVGARLTVGKKMSVGSGCWVYPVSHPTAGDSPKFEMGRLEVSENGGFDAYSRGYTGAGPKNAGAGCGPGRGRGNGLAASYGGYGGASKADVLAPVYATAKRPLQPGSGAGGHGTTAELSGAGGGLVWIEARRSVVLAGALKADGTTLTSSGASSGSGGGIFVRCETWTATETASISAHGGNGKFNNSYAGGGGRVALLRFEEVDSVAVTPNLLCGTGHRATPDFIKAMDNPEGRIPDMTTGSFYLGRPPAGLCLMIK